MNGALAAETCIEGVDHAPVQGVTFGRFEAKQVLHIAPPVLISAAIAGYAGGMGAAKCTSEIDRIAHIVLVPPRQAFLSQTGRRQYQRDSEERGNKE